MGALLILLQLAYPGESEIAEYIFSKIAAQRSFNFPFFGPYLITPDFIEELLYLWNTISDIKYVFNSNKSDVSYMSNSKPSTSGAAVPMNSSIMSSKVTMPAHASASSSRRRRSSHHDKHMSSCRVDLRPMFKQQILRCNENIFTVITNFIAQEQIQLINSLFPVKPIQHTDDA